jgi:hypothetical protein
MIEAPEVNEDVQKVYHTHSWRHTRHLRWGEGYAQWLDGILYVRSIFSNLYKNPDRLWYA